MPGSLPDQLVTLWTPSLTLQRPGSVGRERGFSELKEFTVRSTFFGTECMPHACAAHITNSAFGQHTQEGRPDG